MTASLTYETAFIVCERSGVEEEWGAEKVTTVTILEISVFSLALHSEYNKLITRSD